MKKRIWGGSYWMVKYYFWIILIHFDCWWIYAEIIPPEACIKYKNVKYLQILAVSTSTVQILSNLSSSWSISSCPNYSSSQEWQAPRPRPLTAGPQRRLPWLEAQAWPPSWPPSGPLPQPGLQQYRSHPMLGEDGGRGGSVESAFGGLGRQDGVEGDLWSHCLSTGVHGTGGW